MQRMVLNDKAGVEQLANLLGRGRRRDPVKGIQSFGGRHVMRGGTYTANPRGNLRHLLGRAPLRELLKPAQLRDLEEGAIHASLLIEEDLDLPVAFKPSNGIDGNPSARGFVFHPTFVIHLAQMGMWPDGQMRTPQLLTAYLRSLHYLTQSLPPQHRRWQAVAVKRSHRVREPSARSSRFLLRRCCQ